jgi:hypothetical protein
MTWNLPHSLTTKKFKIEPSARRQWRPSSGTVKASFCVNFSHQKQQSTAKNTAKLSKNCAKPLNERPGRLTTGVTLLDDGTRSHTSAQTAAWLQKRKCEVLQHPPHSPDLAQSDFYLFGPFKKFLSGKRFEDQKALQKTVVQ